MRLPLHPHDTLFKAAFETPRHAEDIFRSLLPAALTDKIAWDTLTRDNTSLVTPESANRHCDLLFSAQAGGREVLLYLLLEHQSTNDPTMPFRMLIYMVKIWERFATDHPGKRLPAIIPLVVAHAPSGWTAPLSFREMVDADLVQIPELAAFVPNFSMLVEDLAHLTNEDIKAHTVALFPQLALWLLRDARDAEHLIENLRQWGVALNEVDQAPNGMRALAHLMEYVARVTDQLHLERFRAILRELAPRAEAAAMTIAEEMRREGEAKGRIEGRQEGRVEERAAVLVKLLTLKFDALSAADLAKVEAADEATLERYLEQFVNADSVAAVLGG